MAAASLVSWPARAEPQGNAALTIGGAGVGPDGQFWDHAEFHLGARGDVLFGRSSASDFGLGPYVEVGTFAFDEVQFGGGGSVLLPAHDNFPFVASVGAYGRWGDDDYGLEPGLTGALFWGSRSYNFHANYVMTGGLLVGFRQSLGESKESILLIGAQLDFAFMGIPIVGLIDLMRGPSDEVAPVEPSAR
ncbi:MAG: hypothetical protein JRI23_23370 [Deltaproteobacteria bacterium]|nr:hypothetical protein [Deltaproteobacteria bacterium]MBW2534914.1 hypothetical protein [Deltaproteobacteria bacterium]